MKTTKTTRGPARITRPARSSDDLIPDDNFDVEIDESLTAVDETAFETPKAASRGLREAAIRAEQIRKKMEDDGSNIDFHDDFYIDPRKIPDGWDYNWKRHTTANMPDPAYERDLLQAGWEPVDTSRHPEMMPPRSSGPIIRKGMMLMERPKEISDMAKQRELASARELVHNKERELGLTPSGTFQRDNRTGVKKSYGPVDIPRT